MKKELKVKDYVKKSDITYKQYELFKKLIPLDEKLMTDIDREFMVVRMLKIFYDINPKDVKLLKASQVSELCNKVNAVLMLPISDLKRIISYRGVLYGLIPNFLNISYGELVDMDDRLKEDDFISLMSILYRPIKGDVNKLGEYSIVEYTEYDDKFIDISLDIVESCMNFFIMSFYLLRIDTNTSIEEEK